MASWYLKLSICQYPRQKAPRYVWVPRGLSTRCEWSSTARPSNSQAPGGPVAWWLGTVWWWAISCHGYYWLRLSGKNLDLNKRSFINPNNSDFFINKIHETKNQNGTYLPALGDFQIWSPRDPRDSLRDDQNPSYQLRHLQLKRLHHGSDTWQREG